MRPRDMPRGRVQCFKSDDGQTASAIAGCLATDIQAIADAGADFYSATDFCVTRADHRGIAQWSALVEKLRALDVRGAFFSQEDMVSGIALAVDANQMSGKVMLKAQGSGIGKEEFIQLLALKLRALLAHVRGSKAAVKTEHPEAEPKPAAYKKRRVHPFVAFRKTRAATTKKLHGS